MLCCFSPRLYYMNSVSPFWFILGIYLSICVVISKYKLEARAQLYIWWFSIHPWQVTFLCGWHYSCYRPNGEKRKEQKNSSTCTSALRYNLKQLGLPADTMWNHAPQLSLLSTCTSRSISWNKTDVIFDTWISSTLLLASKEHRTTWMPSW